MHRKNNGTIYLLIIMGILACSDIPVNNYLTVRDSTVVRICQILACSSNVFLSCG